MADVSVRPALPDDAAAIAAVQQAAVGADHPELGADVLAAIGSDAARAVWEDAVRRPPSAQHRVLVALDGRRLVGFAVLAPPSDDDVVGRELFELRVHPDDSRAGHGSRLLAAVADVLRPEGVDVLTCWASVASPLEELLGATGWAPDGRTRELEAGEARLSQRRWVTGLAG
jgi:ribosomal protein S18 acetylase RimI-like enzyme